MTLAGIYFKKWIDYVSFKRYDRWCEEFFNEIKEEELGEVKYSIENDMDSIYWCWNCKHSECEVHF